MNKEQLRSGDRASVRFRFLLRPEYLHTGARFVFREGKTKGIGLIMNCHNNIEDEEDIKKYASFASPKSTAAQ